MAIFLNFNFRSFRVNQELMHTIAHSVLIRYTLAAQRTEPQPARVKCEKDDRLQKSLNTSQGHN